MSFLTNKDKKMKINFKKATLLLAVCFCALTSMSMFANPGITQIVTDHAPKAIGPYSQGIKAGSYVFVSGQIGIDPKTGKLAGETIEIQTKQAIKNMEAILANQGLTLENIVKTDVYLTDLQNFQIMNGIYGEGFSYAIKPARATVQVSKLPMGALVEISCFAYLPEA